jgi:hypothetical protein
MKQIDLYTIHEQKTRDGLLTIHPSRWLHAGRRFGRAFDPFCSDHQAIWVGDQFVENFRGLSDVNLGSKIRHKGGHYFATPAVANRYLTHVPKGSMLECAVRDMLTVQYPDGRVEVRTPVGFIDLLFPTSIMEVKSFKKWKHALGQVLAYSAYYPDRSKIIHLYVSDHETPNLNGLLQICQQFGVNVSYQNLLPSMLGAMSRVSPLVATSSSEK